MNKIDLNGKRAVVTGGARGMGFAFARRFLQSGAAAVTLWDVEAAALEAAVEALAPLGAAAFRRVDVAEHAEVEAAAAEAAKQMGGVDILVNAAGIIGATVPLEAYPVEVWRQVMDVNLNGIFYACRAVVPHMRAGGYGRIVSISSMAGKEGNPNASAYSVSKAGVIGLTKSLGKELADTDIRVNCVCPAVIDTEMLRDTTQAQIDYMVSKIPMGRMGSVEEVAALVAWMCSEECGYSTGAVYDISGGRAVY